MMRKTSDAERQTSGGEDLDRNETSRSVTGSHSEENSSAVGMRPKHTVLFVDDEPMILEALKRSLVREKYNILTAESLQEAISVIRNNNIDVIITDFAMPWGTGSELLKIVKRMQPQCIRILLTGVSMSDSVPDEIASEILHCQKFIVKPADDDQLKMTIRECIAQYEASCEKDTPEPTSDRGASVGENFDKVDKTQA